MTATAARDRRTERPTQTARHRAETAAADLWRYLDREEAGGASHVRIAAVRALLAGAR